MGGIVPSIIIDIPFFNATLILLPSFSHPTYIHSADTPTEELMYELEVQFALLPMRLIIIRRQRWLAKKRAHESHLYITQLRVSSALPSTHFNYILPQDILRTAWWILRIDRTEFNDSVCHLIITIDF